MSGLLRVVVSALCGLLAVSIPTTFFLLAVWHARTLDLGEKYGYTGFILLPALAFATIATAAVWTNLPDGER